MKDTEYFKCTLVKCSFVASVATLQNWHCVFCDLNSSSTVVKTVVTSKDRWKYIFIIIQLPQYITQYITYKITEANIPAAAMARGIELYRQFCEL